MPAVSQNGGCFLLPSPTVAGSFHFQKWSALRCPDFPLALLRMPATGRGTVLQYELMYYFSAKLIKTIIKQENRLSFCKFLNECKLSSTPTKEALSVKIKVLKSNKHH